MSHSLDPDQAQGFVWPDLGPEVLQRFSAGNISPLVLSPLLGKEYKNLS